MRNFKLEYAAAVFLGAFLLFQVQPLLGKAVLPWFGGVPAVWTVCLLFFQVVLLGGYIYAHLIATGLSPRGQALAHLWLLLASLAFLNILPSEAWRPSGREAPAWRILCLLGANVGVPCLVLSATSPLMQAWFGSGGPRRQPYRLYALSNAGSMLALLAYPFLVEPFLPLKSQAAGWAALYVLFALVCGWCAVSFLRCAGPRPGPAPEPAAAPESCGAGGPPGLRRRMLWAVLAACGSALLLATTNQLTQDVSVVPFLWILPLALYLVSFILCFGGKARYRRPAWIVFLAFACAGVCYSLYAGNQAALLLQILIYLLTLFIACMACHGELAGHKPPPEYLTEFYVLVSAGGALGAALAAVAAPLALNGPWEYHLAWMVLCAVMLAILACEEKRMLRPGRGRCVPFLLLALYSGFVYALWRNYRNETRFVIDMKRNFYGTLSVYKADYAGSAILALRHGRIAHGFQFRPGDQRRRRPVSYYAPASGAGAAVLAMRRLVAGRRPLRLGVVGLGAGVMAAWGRRGDRLTFYEINPLLARLSGRYFTYVRDSPAVVNIVMGDARLSLEREAARGPAAEYMTLDALASDAPPADPQPLDILALDAFTGDAIPLHLLTREAFGIYFRRLRPGGVLAVHISNLFVDLRPLVRGLALECGKKAVVIDTPEDAANGVDSSSWMLVTSDEKFLKDPLVGALGQTRPADSETVVFTDQYSNLLRLLDADIAVSAF